MLGLSCNYSFESTHETFYCCTERFLSDFGSFSLRASVLSWAVVQTFLSKMDHTQKSRELKSGNKGSYNSFFQNEGKWRSHQSCVLFAVWEGAQSCWKVNCLFLKCFFIWVWAGVKISSMYKFALISALSLTKMRWDSQLSEMAAQSSTTQAFGDGKQRSRMCRYYPHSLPKFCRSSSWIWPQQWTFSRWKRWFHQPACHPSLHSRVSSIFPTSFASAMPLVVVCLSSLRGTTWGLP